MCDERQLLVHLRDIPASPRGCLVLDTRVFARYSLVVLVADSSRYAITGVRPAETTLTDDVLGRRSVGPE